MNIKAHEDQTAFGRGDENRSHRPVKCYWLFDTESGAPSIPSGTDMLHEEVQLEE